MPPNAAPVSPIDSTPRRFTLPARLQLPLIAFGGLAFFTAVYLLAAPAYFAILSALMVRPYKTPFIDLAQLPALVSCFHQGVDVYLTAPCDPLNRVFAYSPLLLRTPFLPTDPLALPYLGLGLTSLFAASLALLPAPRRPAGAVLFAATLFSGLPTFALERGNMDVLMFLLIITGTVIVLRGGVRRYAGYGLLGLAGLLKFYPLSLTVLYARERPSRAVALLTTISGAVALFLWCFHNELREMSRNLPAVSDFTDGFGARELATGLLPVLHGLVGERGTLAALLASPHAQGLGVATFLVVGAISLLSARRFANDPGFRAALGTLTEEERLFLSVGATLIGSCFLLLPNVGYRGIHLLFVMPGFAALALSPQPGWPRSLFRAGVVALLIATWALTLQQVVAALSSGTAYPIGGSAACFVYWILHELDWWFLETIVLAIVLAELETSVLAGRLIRR